MLTIFSHQFVGQNYSSFDLGMYRSDLIIPVNIDIYPLYSSTCFTIKQLHYHDRNRHGLSRRCQSEGHLIKPGGAS